MKRQTTGVRFLLDATAEERQAIKMVRLLLTASELWAIQNRKRSLTVWMSDVSKHLHVFAYELGVESDMYQYTPNTGICPAVELYHRAHDNGSGMRSASSTIGLDRLDEERVLERSLSESPIRTSPHRIRAAVNAFFNAIGQKKAAAAS